MLATRRGCQLVLLKRRALHQLKSGRCYMSTHDIRRNFIRFFENYDHIQVPSSSVVPSFEDRSLLFTNAGMNQFKSLLLGRTDNRWAFLKRAVGYQKCIRAGGKHNDLEDVGKDLHHQTFFEMLGNWSFNDSYSKEDACKLAWHFLTEVLSIDPDRLYVSYFGGSSKFNLPSDENCKKAWLDIGVSESHILPFVSENFWEMGSTGPCGPCTEIHYDRIGGRKNVGHLVNVDKSVVELWNIVFISLLRTPNGDLHPLPSHHIDTGMGLERLASVMQNVPSNFDIDAFVPIMKYISSVSKRGKYGGKVGAEDISGCDASYRILADHLRAAVIALADGVEPSAVDAGFIVRKMLRKSFWHARNRLGIDRFACSDLVPVVIGTLKMAYPELTNASERIQKCIADEERQYWSVIDKGYSLFEQMRLNLPGGSTVFPGEDAFTLLDTHGVPIEVTEDLAKEHGLDVDTKRFLELKEQAKILSRSQSGFSKSVSLDTTGLKRHSDKAKYNYSIDANGSYVFPSVKTNILAVFSENERVDSLSSNGSLVLEDCQFYAEEGGQKCDKGLLEIDGFSADVKKRVLQQSAFEVSCVEKVNGVAVLHGKILGNHRITQGSSVTQKIDVDRRMALMRAHTATHLLNWALRRVGAGRGQRGSSIDEDSLRFDYATDDCAGEDDIVENIESLVCSVISQAKPVTVEEMPLQKAAEIPQLQSEFMEGKEYPEIVRVARVGSGLDEAFAVECCSGTHVLNTSSISSFAILSDRSSAKGVRRIFALTGEKATQSQSYGEEVVSRLESQCSNPTGLPANDIAAERIDWAQMPYQDNVRARELLKMIKKKRKSKKQVTG
ncbi:alanine--tRNA ligase domain protein [Ancylostoma caninum]|uniref:Alanine--tRNA ligase n=1 Tax=Ancylostoma caninum TaxID=29170 RepID=A0A368FXM0_ANCCA|nr:alanine--tRNA ligase domain protein [Ancylostoma caninum]